MKKKRKEKKEKKKSLCPEYTYKKYKLPIGLSE